MEPDKRPSFSTLVQTLSKSLEVMASYRHIEVFTGLNEENTHHVQIEATAVC